VLSDPGASLDTDPRIVALALFGALVSAFAAGYAAAWVAPGDELPNALAIGVLLVAISAASYDEPELGLYPSWYTISTLGFTVPSSLLGGLLRRGPAVRRRPDSRR
jgi:hypothetical protein